MLMNMKKGNKFIVCRHFETKKNSKSIHGKSHLSNLTSNGNNQCKAFAKIIEQLNWIDGITYTQTAQAKVSATNLSKLTGIPLLSPLSLAPFNLGIASGISDCELRKINLKSAQSIDLFRLRVIDATRINISESENIHEFDKRLRLWWEKEGKSICNHKIIIGSNSTVLMITNILLNKYPKSGKYYCFTISNGAFRVWESRVNSFFSYPDINKSIFPEAEISSLTTMQGEIAYTKYYPSWSPLNRKCIIAPGYFGNSRHGPYGLYVRLARNLAKIGIETCTFDYLGSGESTPLKRTYETDLYSLERIINNIYNPSFEIFVIAHSAGCSVVSELLRNNPKIKGIGLAPFCILKDYHTGFFTNLEYNLILSSGKVIRKGIELDLQYLKKIEDSWLKNKKLLSKLFIGGEDQYDKSRNSIKGIEEKVTLIEHADHNFASENSSFILIKRLIQILESGSHYCSEHQLVS